MVFTRIPDSQCDRLVDEHEGRTDPRFKSHIRLIFPETPGVRCLTMYEDPRSQAPRRRSRCRATSTRVDESLTHQKWGSCSLSRCIFLRVDGRVSGYAQSCWSYGNRCTDSHTYKHGDISLTQSVSDWCVIPSLLTLIFVVSAVSAAVSAPLNKSGDVRRTNDYVDLFSEPKRRIRRDARGISETEPLPRTERWRTEVEKRRRLTG